MQRAVQTKANGIGMLPNIFIVILRKYFLKKTFFVIKLYFTCNSMDNVLSFGIRGTLAQRMCECPLELQLFYL
jgi:hypothetical protein